MADPRDTPAMRQYFAFKRKHPDCVLFFRMGDFYEMFDEDAVSMSRALGLTLTQRSQGVPMAGVPYHQLTNYLQRAVEAGFRVAVADQVQDPKEAKGVVERRVTRVVTPGTLVDEALVRDEQSSALAAIAFVGEGDDPLVGIAIVDASTGEFRFRRAFADDVPDVLARAGVSEVIYCDPGAGRPPARVARVLQGAGVSGTPRPSWHFRRDEAVEAITDQYHVASLAGFGLAADDPEIPAIGAAIRYLRETQAGSEPGDPYASRATLAHLRPPRREDDAGACAVDSVSLRALEVERTIREGSLEGSLLGVLLGGKGVCRTPMGKRLLRDWLRRPLSDLARIEARHDAVGALASDQTLREAIGEALDPVQDIARLIGRIALARASARDLVALARSLAALPRLAASIRECPALAAILARLEAVSRATTTVASGVVERCVDAPPPHLREGGLIRDGVDAALDEARSLQRDAGQWLSQYQERLSREHDLPSLKVGFNKVFGYFIELPAAQARRAPDLLTRTQTLKNAERYTTPELREFERKVGTAEASAVAREVALFESMCDSMREHVEPILGASDTVAELDTLLGLGEKSAASRWVLPRMVEQRTLEIHGGRHPVLERTLGSSFVPNDAALGIEDTGDAADRARLGLITGPNMAGKSTYIRQVALIVLLAHAGSFVPADRATIGIVDRIFTRVGADDALHQGQSTFMVEMTETANILNHASERSLVILDEIGRGTSTLDGLSLAWAIAERLAHTACLTLFATHYHELTELAEREPSRVRNLHVLVREWDDQITFLHRIEPGRTDRSYGVHVARLAGVPAPVIERAREILSRLSVEERTRVNGQSIPQPAAASDGQLSLFTEYLPHPALERLREVKLETLSPVQAFDVLRELHAIAAPPDSPGRAGPRG
ncbi:MAG: DNA mismatch repair protein MutS [Phycisphaeraceae bacterium]|nr:DNA mismatch repair protein MutS [Phycisphaeraceae bacterium]